MGTFTDTLRAWAADTQAKADAVVVKSVLELQNRIKVRTPVDTGRLRANWQYGLDRIPEGDISLAEGVGRTLGVATSQLPAQMLGFGHVHYIVNNLPYARRIEHGFVGQDRLGRSYNQTGRQMVALSVAEWPQIVEAAVASMGSKP